MFGIKTSNLWENHKSIVNPLYRLLNQKRYIQNKEEEEEKIAHIVTRVLANDKLFKDKNENKKKTNETIYRYCKP